MTHYCKNGDRIRVGGVYEWGCMDISGIVSVVSLDDDMFTCHRGLMGECKSLKRELPRDIDGYYLWHGKECPVPREWEIEANGLGGLHICHAKRHTWGNVSRFRVISTGEDVQEVEPPTNSEQVEVLNKLTQLGQDMGEYDAPRSAEAFLHQAASLMAERGKEYDKPTGERSMGNTIVAFNAITGRDLSEAEGWLLMSLVKRVRQYSTPKYHRDSAEDAVPYAALEAEALERGE